MEKSVSCLCVVWFVILVNMVEAIPVLESAPGIEILPAEFSEDDSPKFVLVDESKGTNTNNPQQSVVSEPAVQTPEVQKPQIVQYQQPVTQAPQIVQYQQPAAQQPQYQYGQPQPVYQQQSPYYRPQPQIVQYPGQPTYYGAPPPGFSPYGSPQPGPYSSGPIGERGRFAKMSRMTKRNRFP
uniref:DUF4794 domain-containing protein n=1 Tax=Anopheles maculatus TaxID=74869 RepID=A0A182SKH0_9DIPT